VNTPTDDRAPLTRAYDRATRGMTVAIGMVVPGLAGHYLDDRLGTRVVFTIFGFAIGLAFGVWQLVRLASSRPGGGDKTSSKT